MKAKIHVTLKNGVLDPQGKAIEHALAGLGFGGVDSARQGKYIELDLAETDPAKAQAAADKLNSGEITEEDVLKRTSTEEGWKAMRNEAFQCSAVHVQVGVQARAIVVEVEGQTIRRPSSELLCCTHAGTNGCPIGVMSEPKDDVPGSNYIRAEECQYIKTLNITHKKQAGSLR